MLQLHCARGSHITVTVFPNVYKRVSVLSVSHVLTGQKLQTSYTFICFTVPTILGKRLKEPQLNKSKKNPQTTQNNQKTNQNPKRKPKCTQLFSSFFILLQLLKLHMLVCFQLFKGKQCTQYSIRPVMVYIREHMWLQSFSLSKRWAAAQSVTFWNKKVTTGKN